MHNLVSEIMSADCLPSPAAMLACVGGTNRLTNRDAVLSAWERVSMLISFRLRATCELGYLNLINERVSNPRVSRCRL